MSVKWNGPGPTFRDLDAMKPPMSPDLREKIKTTWTGLRRTYHCSHESWTRVESFERTCGMCAGSIRDEYCDWCSLCRFCEEWRSRRD